MDEYCRGKKKHDKKTAVSFVNQHPFGYNNKKLRIYKCHRCNMWHLTKKQ